MVKDCVAFWLLMTLALLADGLMEALGPLGFALVSALLLAVAWALIEWPGRDRHRR